MSARIRVAIEVELGDASATRSWASAITRHLAGWRVDTETVQAETIELLFSAATPPPDDAATLADTIAAVGRELGIGAAEIEVRCENGGKPYDDATLVVRE